MGGRQQPMSWVDSMFQAQEDAYDEMQREEALQMQNEQGRNSDELQGVSLLGNQNTQYDYQYNPRVLETFVNKHQEVDYMVTLNCPEFTSLCPKTGQPDFATIYINYIPNWKMVESKSLKLYLFSFRQHGDFHEDVTVTIMKDLVKLMEPRFLEVRAHFLPRGGISIDPYVSYGDPGTEWVEFARERLIHNNATQLQVNNR